MQIFLLTQSSNGDIKNKQATNANEGNSKDIRGEVSKKNAKQKRSHILDDSGKQKTTPGNAE